MGIDDVIVGKTSFDRVLKNRGNRQEALIKAGNENHAASICLDNGNIYIVWFAGSEIGKGDVAIYYTDITNDGNIFSEPKLIARIIGYSCQNPVIFKHSDGIHLVVYFTAQPGMTGNLYSQVNSLIFRIESTDGGKSWSEKSLVIGENNFFIKSHPRRIKDTLYLPVYTDFSNDENYSSLLFSIEPFGEKLVLPGTGGLVQPCILEINGRYQIYYRDRASEWIYRSISSDGIIWERPTKTALKNNNSGICFISYCNKILGAINPTRVSRYPLTLIISDDAGETWKNVVDLHDDMVELYPGYCYDDYAPEFSYPSMLIDGDILHIVYSYCRGGIAYVRITLANVC